MNDELIKKIWKDKADIVISAIEKHPPSSFYSSLEEIKLRSYKILKEVSKAKHLA